MKFPNDYVIGFFTHKDTENMDIIGTSVIPEFGIITIMILSFNIGSDLLITQILNIILTRIN